MHFMLFYISKNQLFIAAVCSSLIGATGGGAGLTLVPSENEFEATASLYS